MKVHLLRTTSIKDGKPFWIASDGVHLLNGKKGETWKQLLIRWVDTYGPYTGTPVRYKGLHQPAEAACTLGSLIMEARGEK